MSEYERQSQTNAVINEFSSVQFMCCEQGLHLLVRAFIVYVRPIVEYNSVIWSPVAKHDIELVEKVQRRFTKRLRGLRNLSYCDRLTELGLSP